MLKLLADNYSDNFPANTLQALPSTSNAPPSTSNASYVTSTSPVRATTPVSATKPASVTTPASMSSLQQTPKVPNRLAPPRIIPLPTNSTRIKPLLNSGRVHEDWHTFIEETAYYILSIGDMTDKVEYALFGRQMTEKYSCVSHPHGSNEEPWVCDCQLLNLSFDVL